VPRGVRIPGRAEHNEDDRRLGVDMREGPPWRRYLDIGGDSSPHVGIVDSASADVPGTALRICYEEKLHHHSRRLQIHANILAVPRRLAGRHCTADGRCCLHPRAGRFGQWFEHPWWLRPVRSHSVLAILWC